MSERGDIDRLPRDAARGGAVGVAPDRGIGGGERIERGIAQAPDFAGVRRDESRLGRGRHESRTQQIARKVKVGDLPETTGQVDLKQQHA